MKNDLTSLLKNSRFGENFEAKNRLDHENKKSPQTSKAACGLDFGGGCRIRTRVDITALMVFKTTPL